MPSLGCEALCSCCVPEMKRGGNKTFYKNINSFIRKFVMVTGEKKSERKKEKEIEREGEKTAMMDTTLRWTYSERCFCHWRFDTEPTSQPVGHLPVLRVNIKPARLIYSADSSHRLTTRVENFHHYTFSGRPHIFLSSVIRMIHFRCPLSTLRQLHILFWNSQQTRPVKGQYVTHPH